MDASLMKASALRLRFSLSLASRRQRLSQAMVRSTTQRLGWTTKPFTRSDHLADSDAPFAAAGLARRDQRLDMRPFRIGQVARITQFVAVVARAVVGSPHGAPQE